MGTLFAADMVSFYSLPCWLDHANSFVQVATMSMYCGLPHIVPHINAPTIFRGIGYSLAKRVANGMTF